MQIYRYDRYENEEMYFCEGTGHMVDWWESTEDTSFISIYTKMHNNGNTTIQHEPGPTLDNAQGY